LGCKKLRKINIPRSVVNIHSRAFEECGEHLKWIESESAFSREPEADEYLELRENDYDEKEQTDQPDTIPSCKEKPFARICCAKEDLPVIRDLLIRLYWEGFNFRYGDPLTDEPEYGCVLAFFFRAHAIVGRNDGPTETGSPN
jgi:hypothetical protein